MKLKEDKQREAKERQEIYNNLSILDRIKLCEERVDNSAKEIKKLKLKLKTK